MQPLLYMIRKEFKQIFRTKEMIGIIFGIPLIQMVVLGFAITTDVKNIDLIVADFDNSKVSREIIRAFEHTKEFNLIGYANNLSEIEEAIQEWDAKIGLVFPINFGKDFELNHKPQIQILVDGVDAECGFSSLTVSIDNGLQASNKIGKIAPCQQTAFKAKINISATMELTDNNTDLVKNKLDQTPIELATYSVDSNGLGYGVHVYAAQLSFSDPSAGAENQFVSMDMSGVAKVDDTLNKAMRIYLMGDLV